MIDTLPETEAPGALRTQHYNLVLQAVRLCVAGAADLCAIYHDTASEPVAYAVSTRAATVVDLRACPLERLSVEASRLAFPLERRMLFAGDRTATLIFATIDGSEIPRDTIDAAVALLGSAIVQAEELAHHSRVSNRLQRALLPARLIHADGFDFSTAYDPAGSESEVGGDWYDSFEIGNGTIGISLGDITGHGLEAAVTMSEIRHAIRTAAITSSSPREILDAVDAVAMSQNARLASAIVGIFDPSTGLLRYASAGHPPPIFVTALGRAQALPAGGALLGLGVGGSPERSVTLSPGTACIFYTDGLIENERDPVLGEETLLETLEDLSKSETLTAAALHRKIVPEGPRDDCASLVVSRPPDETCDPERYAFSATAASARLMRDAVRDYARRAGFDSDAQFSIVTAVGEALANAVEHGDPDAATIAADLHLEGTALTVMIENEGHWRTSKSENRGRGMTIMRAYAKHVQISSNSKKTSVSLLFEL